MKLNPFILLPLLALNGCAALEREEDIPLAKVPEHVMQAARQAVPGIEVTEAEIEKEDGETVYELSGEVDGKEYEIEISADGRVLETESD